MDLERDPLILNRLIKTARPRGRGDPGFAAKTGFPRPRERTGCFHAKQSRSKNGAAAHSVRDEVGVLRLVNQKYLPSAPTQLKLVPCGTANTYLRLFNRLAGHPEMEA